MFRFRTISDGNNSIGKVLGTFVAGIVGLLVLVILGLFLLGSKAPSTPKTQNRSLSGSELQQISSKPSSAKSLNATGSNEAINFNAKTNINADLTIAKNEIIQGTLTVKGATINSATFDTIDLKSPLAVTSGGTGLNTIPANGQILIGNGAGYYLGNVIAGSGIQVAVSPAGITLSSNVTAGVSSVQGQSGAVNFVAGNGIGLSGTTISNAGVVSLSSASAGLTIVNNGNGNLTITDTDGGPSSTVALGPNAAQVDSSNNPSIFINKTGAGNLLQFSVGAAPVNRFVVDQSGVITTGTIDFGQVTGKPSFVNSLDGATGALLLGTGLTRSGQTISNSGVTSLTGTANQVNVSGATGAVTLTLPQSIDVTASPTFTNLTLSGNATVHGGNITVGVAGPAGTTGSVAFKNSTNANTLTIQSGATGSNLTFTLPTADGAGGQCIKTDGIGNLSFGSCLATNNGVTSLDGLNGALTLANSTGAGSTITIDDASTTGKGIAEFNSTNFQVSGGIVNTIQGIATSSSPTFAGLTITGNETLNTSSVLFANNLTQTANGQNMSINAGSNIITFYASGQSFVFPSSGGLGQTICTSGITCASGGGEAVILAPSAIQNDPRTFPSIWVNDTGGGNLIQMQENGLDQFIVSNTGNITTSGIITLGKAGPAGTTGAVAFKNSTNANTLTLQSGISASNLTLTLPSADGTSGQCIKTDGAGNLSFGACLSGSSGSGVASLNGLTGTLSLANATGSGSTVTINDASTAAKGIASFNSTNFSAAAGAVNTIQDIATSSSPTFTNLTLSGLATVQGASVTVGTAGPAGTTGSLILKNSSNTNTLTLQSGVTGSNLTFTLPTADGTANQCLKTDGAGGLSWTTCLTGGGGGSGGVTSLDGLSGVLTLANSSGSGSTVTINDASTVVKGIASFNSTNFSAASGAINTIQNIASSSSPTFAGLTLSGTATVQGSSVTVGTAGPAGTTGSVVFKNSTNANTVTLQSGTTGSNLIFTLPTADGSAGQCVKTDGGGNLSFGMCGGVTSVNGLTGSLTVANATGSGTTITINDASTAAKGIASFNSTNFTAASGAINTIQDIATTSSPTFTNLTLSGNATVHGGNATLGVGGVGGATGNLLFKNTTNTNNVTLQSGITSVANLVFTLPTADGSVNQCIKTDGAGNLSFGTCLSGGGGGGGVTSLDALTGVLSLANSSGAGSTVTIDNASTAAKGIAQFNSTNFSAASGTINTIQDIATSSSPSFTNLTLSGTAIIQGSSVTVGTAGPAGTTGSIVFKNSSNANLLTLQSGVTGGALTFTLPTADGTSGQCIKTDGAGNLSFGPCLSTNNGVTSLNGLTGALTVANATGSGSTVTINDASTAAKGIASFNSTNFTAASGAINTIQNIASSSSPTFAGLTLSGTATVQGSSVTVGTAGPAGTTGSIAFKNSSNTNIITLQSGITGGALTFTLPTADGTGGQCVKTDGAGNLSFGTCLTGGSGSGVASLNGLTGTLTLANATGSGTTVTINDASTSAKGIAQFSSTNFTVSSGAVNTIQNITTTSAPTFGGLTVNGSTNITSTATGSNVLSLTDNSFSSTGASLANLLFTNANTSASSTAVNGLTITPSGSTNTNANANTLNAIQLPNVTPIANNAFYAVNVGTGYNDILRYNGTQLISGSGLLQNAAIDSTLTYSNITKVGTITTGVWNGSTIDIAHGGTNGTATPSNGQVAYGTGSAYAFTTGGSTGNCLSFNSGSAPTWISCAPSTGGSGYVQLQGTTPGTQQTGNANISGTFIAGTRIGIATSSPSADLTFGEGADRTINVLTRTTNVIGNALTIAAGNAGAGASAFAGGALYLQAGNAAGTGNATGGAVSVTAGSGIGSGAGGSLSVSSGAAGSTGGAGGALSVTAANGNTVASGSPGAGGALSITSGGGGTSNDGAGAFNGANAGNLNITAGTGGTGSNDGFDPSNGGNGGIITLQAGNGGGGPVGGNAGLAGAINITAGNGGQGYGTGANGGNITIKAGSGNSVLGGNGGILYLQGGAKGGAQTSGYVVVKPQASNDSTTAFQVQNAAGTGVFTVDTSNSGASVASAATTTNGLAVTANSLTTGAALSVTSSSTSLTTGNLASIADTGTYTTQLALTGNTVNVARNITSNVTSGSITLDNKTNTPQTVTSASSATIAYTVGTGSNRALIVSIGTTGTTANPVTSVTYNGVPLTEITSAYNSAISTTVDIWILANPAVGTNNVVINWNATRTSYVGISSWYGVNQSTPAGAASVQAPAPGTPPSLSVASAVNDVVLDTLMTGGSVYTANAGQTPLYQTNPIFASNKAGAAGTTSVGWTYSSGSQYGAYAGFALKVATTPGINLGGSVATFSSNCTVTAGSCADSSNILSLSQQYATATGAVLAIQNAGSGPDIQLGSGAIQTAATNLTSTNSKNVTISTGNATGATSSSGNISIDVGTATGTTGTVSLGASNASALTIGSSTVTTSIRGTVSMPGHLSFGSGLSDKIYFYDSGTPATSTGIGTSASSLNIFTDISGTNINFKTGGSAGTVLMTVNGTGGFSVPGSSVTSTVTGTLAVNGTLSVPGHETFGSGLGDKMYFYDSGVPSSSVGIGTSAGSLNLFTDTSATSFNFRTGGSAGTVLMTVNGGGGITVPGNINTNTGYRISNAATSGHYLRGNGTNYVDSAILAADLPAGSGNYIQNGTSIQTTANFAIQSAAAGSVGGVIKAATSQTADLLDFQNSGGTVLSKFDASGNLSVGSSTAPTGGVAALMGNVGIGTTSPTAATGWSSGTVLNIVDTTNNLPHIRLQNTNVDAVIGVDSGNLHVGTQNSMKLAFSTNNTAAMTIDTSQRVGIGTTSPQQALTLGQNDNIAVNMAAPGAPTGTPSITGGSMSAGTYYYKITALDGVGETVGGTESSAQTIASGTTGSVALTWTAIQGAASYKVYRTTVSGTYTTPAYIANPTTNSYTDTAAGVSAGAPPTVTTAYVNKLNASGNSYFLGGNVGVGTATPGSRLTVGNSTGSEDILVQALSSTGVASLSLSAGHAWQLKAMDSSTNTSKFVIRDNSATADRLTIDFNGNITEGGTINSQTISSTANFTGTLAVQGANSLTLGTASTNTGSILFKGSGSANTLTLIGPASPSTNTLTLPNETGTLCSTGSVCTGYAPSTGGTGYIQNGTSIQASANFAIQSAAAGSVGGVIKGAASQTADLLQLQNSSGTALGYVTKDGVFYSNNNPGGFRAINGYQESSFGADALGNNGQQVYINTGITSKMGLVIRGVTSQTSDLLQLQNSGGTVLSSFDSNGDLHLLRTSTANITGSSNNLNINFNTLGVLGQSASSPVEVIRGAASQTADLLQAQDTNGITLSKLDANGQLISYGTNTNLLALATPAGVTASAPQAGGSLTVGTPYYWVVTATNAQGETVKSAEVTQTPTTGNQTVTISWTRVTGATGYKIYRSTTAGTYTTPALVVTIASGTTLSFADTGAAASAGAPSTPAGTGITVQGWQSQTGNLLQIQDSSGNSLIYMGIGSTRLRVGDANNNDAFTVSSNGTVQATAAGQNVTGFRTGAGDVILSRQAALGSVNGANYLSSRDIGDVSLVVRAMSGQTADLLQLQNSGNAVLSKFDASGNAVLGGGASVGTITPSVLEVQGSSASRVGITSFDTASAAVGTGGSIDFGGYTNTTTTPGKFGSVGAYKEGIAVGNTASYMAFYVNNNTGYNTLQEAMRISSNGNLGIGTTSNPGSQNRLIVNPYSTYDSLATTQINTTAATNKGLVVQGFTSQTADLLQLQNSAGTVLTKIDSSGNVITSTSNRLGFSDANSSGIYYDATTNGPALSAQGVNVFLANGGSIIGNGVPLAPRGLAVTPINSSLVGQVIRGVASQTADLLQLQNSAGTVLSKFDASGNLSVGTSTSPTSGVATFNGNVGIGTTSPQQALTLTNGDNFAVNMAAPGTITDTGAITGGTLAAGTYYHKVTALDGVGETVGSTESTCTVASGTTGSCAMSWTAITGAASYKIYRTTTSGTYGATSLVASSTTASYTDTGSALTSGTVPTITTAYVNKLTASGNSYFLGGNVGVGTATPSAKLQVAGSGAFGIDTGALAASAGAVVRVFQDSGLSGTPGSIYTYDYGTSTSKDLILQYPGGNVGIGPISTPAAQLDVYGRSISSVSGNGTNATDILKVSGGNGGATTGTTGQTAGNGANINLTAGSGGSASTGSTNGNGGSILLSAGAAGAGTGTAGTAGKVYIKNQSDSTAVFQIQNATGTAILTADSTNMKIKIGTGTPTLGAGTTGSLYVTNTAEFAGQIRVGDGTNNVNFDGTTHEMTLNGTARHTRKITLTPEYAGAVLDPGSGANNTGTMTSAFDATQRESYYNWTTAQATNQNYDIVVQIPLPSDFSAWNNTSIPMTFGIKTSNTTNGTVVAYLTDTGGTLETTNWNSCSLTPGVTTWTTVNGCAVTGTYSADGVITLRVRMQAPTSGNTQLGNIILTYLSKY